ncbi:hypothetical protein ACWEG1_01735 [Streptomyces bauhiniae]
MPDPQRAAILSRITTWTTGVGGTTDADAAELTDAQLQVIRYAAGAFASSYSY